MTKRIDVVPGEIVEIFVHRNSSSQFVDAYSAVKIGARGGIYVISNETRLHERKKNLQDVIKHERQRHQDYWNNNVND